MIYFEKSQPVPASLLSEKEKANGDYKTQEVLDRLKTDFKNKCYLCEQKELTSINIEHLISHRGDKNLKFDWNNLFLSCPHCNNTKLENYDNILNCTKKEDDVENKLRYICVAFPSESVSIETIDDSEKTILTKELLLAIYNGTTPLKKLEAANLRKKLLNEIEFFNDLLEKYQTTNNGTKQFLLREIVQHLSNTSSFTAFKRWKIKDNVELKAEFEQYFN